MLSTQLIILNYLDPYSVLSFLDDQEQQEPLLEDIEGNGFLEDDYFKPAVDVYFSVDGDYLYTVKGTRIQRINPVTGDVLSERIRKKGVMNLVPVKRGVLFQINSETLELWNSELSVCMHSWTGFVGFVEPLSEERVALCTFMGTGVIILDTTSEKIVSTIANLDGVFLACNNKYEVLTTTDAKFLQLRRENQVLWKSYIQVDLRSCHKSVLFSPTGENIVTCGRTGSYVLDAVSGKVICQLENMNVDDIKFISNEDYIVSLNDPRGLCLRLYNVISGDLLSEIVEKRRIRSYAACPCKRFVAIGFENSKDHFEIIQVKLPGDKEKTKIKRSVETKFI